MKFSIAANTKLYRHYRRQGIIVSHAYRTYILEKCGKDLMKRWSMPMPEDRRIAIAMPKCLRPIKIIISTPSMKKNLVEARRNRIAGATRWRGSFCNALWRSFFSDIFSASPHGARWYRDRIGESVISFFDAPLLKSSPALDGLQSLRAIYQFREPWYWRRTLH